MKGFVPMSFGKKHQQKQPAQEVHSANQRKGRGGSGLAPASAESKGGVSFGPRFTDSATAAGARLRADKAEAKPAPSKADEEDADVKKPLAEPEEPEGPPDALPEPGKESEVLPVSHEVTIPVLAGKAVTAICLDPKGSRMVTGGLDGNLKFFDFNGMSEEKQCFRELEPVENHMVQAVSFSITGAQVLAVCSDSSARIYDREGTAKPIQSTVKGDMYVRCLEHTKGHTQTLTDGMWHPFQQEEFLTSSLDGTIRIWNMNADPVGMDQQLPQIHVLKTLDKRNVCIGGGSGKAGGLYPTCCTYSPTDAKKIVGGCSDGSVQLFFEKARYSKPDKILRTAHTAPITGVAFVPDGGHSNLLVTRSMDNTMKIWDTRMLSDAKGPLKVFENLAASHEKTGLCVSPDGRFIVTGTTLTKGALGSSTVRVFDAKTFSSVKTLDFGKRNALRFAWPTEINQLLVGTGNGDVVMLYSPFSSKKGAMHFVGRKAKAKADPQEELGSGPIFNMTDKNDIQKFYSTGHGDMKKIRRGEVRAAQKTLIPMRPEESGTKMPDSDFGNFAALALKMGAKRLHLNNTRQGSDSQEALLNYQDKINSGKAADSLMGPAYAGNANILDWDVELGEGDQRMNEKMQGEFCGKCGMKMCRCTNYTKWGEGSKKPRTS
ncbi:unnamed protein product [Polarella glacialis]|nr:unnamed protein product [Polarella glacialis]